MASADGGDRAAAGTLRLLMRMAMAVNSAPMPRAGLMMVHHFIFDGDGDLLSGGVGGGGVPPASKEAISSLKEVRAPGGAGSLGDCAICLDAFEAGKEMPCGHRFHGECLERWLGVHGSCPVCRRELPAAEPAAEKQDSRERRGPRGAVVVSYLQVVGEEAPRQQEREEPWSIRIEDVD